MCAQRDKGAARDRAERVRSEAARDVPARYRVRARLRVHAERPLRGHLQRTEPAHRGADKELHAHAAKGRRLPAREQHHA